MPSPARIAFIVDLLTAAYGRGSIAIQSPLELMPVASTVDAPEAGGRLYIKSSDSTLRLITPSGEMVIGGGQWGGIGGTLADQEDLQDALDAKAPLNSPTFTGTVAAAAITLGGNAVATQAYVGAQISALVASSPSALDTLNELAAALGNDPSFAATTATALGNRLRVDAAQGLTSGQKSQALDNLGAGAAGKLVLAGADASAIRSTLALVPGTNVQAYSAGLAALAALSTTGRIYYLSAANVWTQVTVGTGLDFTSGTLSATASASLPVGTLAVMPPQTGDAWLLADTTARSKTTYAALYDAVTFQTTGLITSGSDVIYLSPDLPAHFRGIGNNVLMESSGAVYGITDVSTPGQVTVSPSMSEDGYFSFRVFLPGFGNNDATSFFCGGYVGQEPNSSYGLRYHLYTGLPA